MAFCSLAAGLSQDVGGNFESCVALAPLCSSALLVCPGVFCGPLFPFPPCTSAARERAKRAKRAERLSGVPLCFLCSSASWCSPCLFDLLGFLFVWFRVSPFLWNDRASRSHAKTGLFFHFFGVFFSCCFLGAFLVVFFEVFGSLLGSFFAPFWCFFGHFFDVFAGV